MILLRRVLLNNLRKEDTKARKYRESGFKERYFLEKREGYGKQTGLEMAL